MKTYTTWSNAVPPEMIEAETGFEARKEFAAKHSIPVIDCMSRVFPAAAPLYMIAFPDFPASDLPTIPAAFADTSWHNDVCPSFTSDVLGLTLWVDYAAAAKREHPDTPRFSVTPQDHGVEVSGESFESDDWSEVLAFIEARTLRNEG